MDIDFDPLFQYQGAIGNYSMDWKGITKLLKQVEELHWVSSRERKRATTCSLWIIRTTENWPVGMLEPQQSCNSSQKSITYTVGYHNKDAKELQE